MSRKKVIILSSALLFFAVVAFIIYFLAIHRAKSSLEQLVTSQSEGKLHFSAKKVRLDIFLLRFDFQKPELRTIDSSNAITGYHVKAERISFNVLSLVPVIFGNRLVIDSVAIKSPIIEVIKYKEGPHQKISLPGEMSKVYNSLDQILQVVSLNYLHIGSAKFIVIDRSHPGMKPLQVSNLNLTIDKVSEEQGKLKKKFLSADRILLEIYNEEILFPDGFHRIRFKKFTIGTNSQNIKLDSCYIFGVTNDSPADEFSVFIESLRIYKLDFDLLAKKNTVKFDSAICINPDIKLRLHFIENKIATKLPVNGDVKIDSIDQKLKKMLGNLDIGYLNVKNASVNIVTEKNNKINVFKSRNNNFSISKLVVNNENDIPIQLGQFDIDIHDYTYYSRDSLNIIKFDKISIKDKRIKLYNFSINQSKRNFDPLRREIKMQAFELDEIDWATLLYENRIMAGHASLIKPEIHLILPDTEKSKQNINKKNPFEVLSKISDKVQIGELYIENGLLDIQVSNGLGFFIDNCFAGINVTRLLKTKDALKFIDALDTLTFSKGSFTNPALRLLINGGYFSRESRTAYFDQVIEKKAGRNSETSINGIKLERIDFQSFSNISVSKLSWRQADLNLNMLNNKETNSKEEKPYSKLKFKVKKLQGGPTLLKFIGDNIEASTNINRITTDEIIFKQGHKPIFNGLSVDGHSITLKQETVEGSLGGFTFYDKKKSTIENITVIFPVGRETISLFIPRLDFSVDINQILSGKLTASFIELHKPVISFLASQAQAGQSKIPLLNIGRLTIYQPELKGMPTSLTEKLKIDPGKLSLDFIGINSDNEALKIDSLKLSVSEPGFSSHKIRLIPTGGESINFKASDLIFRPAKNEIKAYWNVNIDSFHSSGIKLDMLHNEKVKQLVAIKSLDFDHLDINSSHLKDLEKFVSSNDHFTVSNGNIAFENDKTRVETFNLGFNKSANSLKVDSLAFYPLADRDAFMSAKEYQSNYIQLYSGLIKATGIDLNLLMNDTVINSKKIIVNDLHFLDYKDKRLPFQHGIEKPLLTDMLKKFKLKILVDSLIIRNSTIEYEEFNNKTKLYGKINFTKIKGGITGIRNYNITAVDSLQFNINARFMNATDLKVKYAQSYTDKLLGFQLKVIGGSFDLTSLNPILEPFSSVNAQSGFLDTLRMSVIGHKHFAYGVMNMYYHGLNVQYLDKGDTMHQSLKAETISFFANRIVHKKKQRGTGGVYAERDPEKGFVNYWVKIFISGVLTNTGVRTNIKQERKYNHSVKDDKVPPNPTIPADY